MEAPFNARIGMLTSQLSGAKSCGRRGKARPDVGFGANALTPEKMIAFIAVTQEFLDAMPGAMEASSRNSRSPWALPLTWNF